MVLLQLSNGLEVHLCPLFIVLLKLENLYIRYDIYFNISCLNLTYLFSLEKLLLCFLEKILIK